MKTKSYIFALMVSLLGLASCENMDYPDRFRPTEGVPTVYSIRYADKDQTISSAFMKEVICILGENLRSVNQVWFNDQQATLNTSYITNNTLLVEVPGSLPTEKTDKIYLKTKAGQTVTFDFKVLAPAPKLTDMSFEFAEPGSTVTMYGNFFVEPLTVTFAGGAEAKVSNVTMTSMDVVIPEGAQPGKVKVETESGVCQSNFNYKDDRGLLFDFDGKTGLGNHGWHNMVITSDETSFDGNFLLLGNSKLDADASWNDGAFSFEYWPGDYQNPETYANPIGVPLSFLTDFSDVENMCLKFEMYIPSSNPWMAGALQVIPAPVTVVSYGDAGVVDIFGNVLGGSNNKYISGEGAAPARRALYRPWEASGSYDTGDKWVTVTIPMNSSTFSYDLNGNVIDGVYNADSWDSLVLFVVGGGVTGTECTPIIKIDNIRAVPNK
ncbi:MAG: hypothetical protein HUJ92_02155 [Bacteroidales bacterium]|mgnify:CR=1 FL=1|nr:hypothetical protein [Bacteroidales bacterium]